jgi:hypothetical protein
MIVTSQPKDTAQRTMTKTIASQIRKFSNMNLSQDTAVLFSASSYELTDNVKLQIHEEVRFVTLGLEIYSTALACRLGAVDVECAVFTHQDRAFDAVKPVVEDRFIALLASRSHCSGSSFRFFRKAISRMLKNSKSTVTQAPS